jgi:hypothetical protein
MNWQLTTVLIAGWAVCASFGVTKMLQYELTPAAAAVAPEAWPQDAEFQRDPTRPTLVLFLHPHCPCSRATLAELERLIAAAENQLALRMIFVVPKAAGQTWQQTALIHKAEQIRRAAVSFDAGGKQAAQFGAQTSGQALLYSADGRLLYRGGLTPSRGHEGDNAGRTAVLSLLKNHPTGCMQSAVFGCCLIQPNANATERPKDATADE